MTTVDRSRSNRELISAILLEDAMALSDLYDLCLEVVNTYADDIPSFLHHEPEDFASEVFVALVKDECAALRRLIEPAALEAYIRQTFLNLVRMELRKQPTPPPVSLEHLPAAQEPHLSPLESHALKIAASQVIAALPDKQRVAFSLWLDGTSYKEIASILGIPIGTVGTYVHRAKVKLRQELAHSG